MSQLIAIAQSELRLATFHHGGRIAALIEAAGCRLLYLPPYSPDFNRIEKCWAWLKSRIRNNLSTLAAYDRQWNLFLNRRRPNTPGDSYKFAPRKILSEPCGDRTNQTG